LLLANGFLQSETIREKAVSETGVVARLPAAIAAAAGDSAKSRRDRRLRRIIETQPAKSITEPGAIKMRVRR
jgi:hypothetical protein